jgi:FtsH ternary system domain X3
MRYRVQFRYREDTGEVEVFRVETLDADPRATGHDAEHDQVTREIAGILDTDPLIEELQPQRLPAESVPAHQAPEEQRRQDPETHGA